MKYIISKELEAQGRLYHSAPLEKSECEYFHTQVLPCLTPVSDQRYIQSFSIFKETHARWSYVLCEDKLYQCVLWPPGLIVLEFSPEGKIRAAAFNSLRPDHNASDEAWDDYDETTDPQYNLVFEAWDATYDDWAYRQNHFSPASPEELALQHRCLRHIDRLVQQVEALHQVNPDSFIPFCKQNIQTWCDRFLASIGQAS
ncbi:hypothetical protein [Neptuniibacter halophilus]|uniref:hypothetical protein n=1 Tax=Neptuniibacter halophilus TaxID=651666 RepID=UPI00257302BB|nr:hypothetical protein [Neptuniibacter halophilus]